MYNIQVLSFSTYFTLTIIASYSIRLLLALKVNPMDYSIFNLLCPSKIIYAPLSFILEALSTIKVHVPPIDISIQSSVNSIVKNLLYMHFDWSLGLVFHLSCNYFSNQFYFPHKLFYGLFCLYHYLVTLKIWSKPSSYY